MFVCARVSERERKIKSKRNINAKPGETNQRKKEREVSETKRIR